MEFIEEDKYKNDIGIYKITNVVNSKYYIGKTEQNFQRRYWHHVWKLQDGTHDNIHLQSAWNKYGSDSFTFSIVHSLSVGEDVNALEMMYIREAKETCMSYNMSDGGDGRPGVPMSESTKKIVGLKNRAHNLGKNHSEDTKKKMSLSRTGQPYTIYRTTTKLNDDAAKKAKILLMSGLKVSEVAFRLNVDYILINNIVCNNTWKHVLVDGWDDFFRSRERRKRKTKKAL